MIERAFIAGALAYVGALVLCAVIGGPLLPIAGALAAIAGLAIGAVVLAAAVFGRRPIR